MTDNQTNNNPISFPVREAIAFICLPTAILGGMAPHCVAHQTITPVLVTAVVFFFIGLLLFRSFVR